MEKDVASSDLLGSTAPIKWTELCEYEGTIQRDVDIIYENKKAGNLVYKSKFIWQEYTVPEPSKILDKYAMLQVIIKEATFKKDADTFGKQDPFIKFKYQGVEASTEVMDNAGKHAKFNELF